MRTKKTWTQLLLQAFQVCAGGTRSEQLTLVKTPELRFDVEETLNSAVLPNKLP